MAPRRGLSASGFHGLWAALLGYAFPLFLRQTFALRTPAVTKYGVFKAFEKPLIKEGVHLT